MSTSLNIQPINSGSIANIVSTTNYNFNNIKEYLNDILSDTTNDTIEKIQVTSNNLILNNKLEIYNGLTKVVDISNLGQITINTGDFELTKANRLILKENSDALNNIGVLGEIIWDGTNFYGYTETGWVNLIDESSIYDIQPYDTFLDLPETGIYGKLYLTEDTNKIYYWNNSQYNEIAQSSTLFDLETKNTSFNVDLSKKMGYTLTTSGSVTIGTINSVPVNKMVEGTILITASGGTLNLTWSGFTGKWGSNSVLSSVNDGKTFLVSYLATSSGIIGINKIQIGA